LTYYFNQERFMAEINNILVLAPLLNGEWMRFSLSDYRKEVQKSVKQIAGLRIIERLWEHDHTIWKTTPDEISNRLGWLHCPEQMQPNLSEISKLRIDLRRAGFEKALLLGMGGSSLAPDLFSKLFPAAPDALELLVLDSTDPGAMLEKEAHLDPVKTIYIVSTKSGGTEETLSFFRYFYQKAVKAAGNAAAGDHFIAITDPGSKLVDLAQKYLFRKIFLNDPNLGGRYSALSYFGLVPATLTGIDSERLLERARQISSLCSSVQTVQQNPAVLLGASLGILATLGRDKLTFINPPQLDGFADWTEQLIAESTGKEGKGILPVVGEELADPEIYGQDRVFVHLYLNRGSEQEAPPLSGRIAALEDAGHPVIHIPLGDVYDIGGQFLLWEIATAVAGSIMQINPFDQPNVEAAKVRARQMVSAYKSSGALPTQTPILDTDQFAVYSSHAAKSVRAALRSFLEEAKTGDYVAIQAYLQPEASTTSALHGLQSTLRAKTHLATTIGYGPRFLHSTGQLHKGDRGNGLFILFTNDPEMDLQIPDDVNSSHSSLSFGTLKLAQAFGDQMALADAGRRLIRIHLHADPVAAIGLIRREIEES
jgi:transaldolase/glucose-6-phosphate isomerase